MKKPLMIVSALCMGSFVFAGAAVAKNAPDPLATVTPGGCSLQAIAPYGTSLRAAWAWEAGSDQTKFGGDAEFTVEASPDGGLNWYEFEVEFELDAYVPGSLAEEYFGSLVYRCSNAVSEASGSCNGSVLGVRDAVLAAAADELGVLPEDIGSNIRASLEGVKVKAMNPGPGNGRQNYERVDVCEVPL